MEKVQQQHEILRFNDVCIRANGRNVLDHVSIILEKGRHLAIIGESGSGKTSLLKALAGELPVAGGHVTHPLLDEKIRSGVIPENRSNWQHYTSLVEVRHHFTDGAGSSNFYYQQRFNAGDTENITTVRHYLSVLADYNTNDPWYGKILDMLNLEPLLDEVLIQLSSGETRRLLIAAALLEKPVLLLLDMPLTGMDTRSREKFNQLLPDLSKEGITVALSTLADQVPGNVSDIIVTKNGQIKYYPGKKDFIPEKYLPSDSSAADLGSIDALLGTQNIPSFRQLISMKDIHIRYGETTILNQLNWEVKQGEKWAVTGANGAGKSTLLSLITADHPQGYANNYLLFDRKRGSGESIWDIKKNIGFVSYELFQYFPGDQSCMMVMESGFYDTIGLFRLSSPEKTGICQKWMAIFNITAYANKLFRQVPTGIQRLCLLVRALVKNPALLILDEPCQGLDDHQQMHFKQIITAIASHPEISMIYVTHDMKELPESFVNILQLTRGEPPKILRRS